MYVRNTHSQTQDCPAYALFQTYYSNCPLTDVCINLGIGSLWHLVERLGVGGPARRDMMRATVCKNVTSTNIVINSIHLYPVVYSVQYLHVFKVIVFTE